MEKGQGSGSVKAPPEPVEALLGRLTLVEEADEEFVWKDEVTDHPEKAKWLAIAKVHTTRGFSSGALFADMRSAWNPAREVRWRRVDDNLFTV